MQKPALEGGFSITAEAEREKGLATLSSPNSVAVVNRNLAISITVKLCPALLANQET